MADSQGNPTQILLFVSLAVLVIVGGGWLLLEAERPEPLRESADAVDAASAEAPATEAPGASVAGPEASSTVTSATADGASDDAENMAPLESAAEEETVAAVRTGSPVDADLRMARIAAGADMLIEPRSQSALHFYSRVLSANPQHDVARAELDVVLGRLENRVDVLLDAEQFGGAYDIAREVAAVSPDHDIVRDVQQVIGDRASELVASAMTAAEQGDEATAAEFLAEVEALPGRNLDYLQAVQDAVADLVRAYGEEQARAEAEERQRAEQQQQDWMARVRTAIAEGRLAGSESGNALELLSEEGRDPDSVSALRGEWQESMLTEVFARIDNEDLAGSDELVAIAEEAGFDDPRLAEVRNDIDDALAAIEAARVVPVAELTAIDAAPAEFPARAELRGISGWVRVEFTVDVDGTTRDIEILAAEPEGIFDNAALEAVSNWTFEPRTFRGRPIEQRSSARLVFRLD